MHLGQDSTDSTGSSPTDSGGTFPSSISVDPALLLWGVGALALGSFLFGGRVEPQRKVREKVREKKRSYYQRKLRELAGG